MTNTIPRLVSIPLRVGELIFAAVVAGLTGEYLHNYDKANVFPQKRFIYTEVVAGLSILFSLLWLIPFSAGFIHYPIDFVLFVLWIVAFGLLVDYIGPLNCGSVFAWGSTFGKGTCQKWKANVAFAFLSAIFWLISALVVRAFSLNFLEDMLISFQGLWFVHRARRGHGAVTDHSTK
ncbi:MAG: hypothetical protein M1833_007289 [Piccolia ochrophora]|nr:MAG: hypothetical protein M1833_007289 [Piccolia ochrophora]